jgi:hypothetical protein
LLLLLLPLLLQIDRCYGWKATNDNAVRLSLADQDESTRNEFQDRADRIRMELNEKGLNAELYWKNDSPANTVSMVPTSAISGEGIPDLLLWLVRVSLFCVSCCVQSYCKSHNSLAVRGCNHVGLILCSLHTTYMYVYMHLMR